MAKPKPIEKHPLEIAWEKWFASWGVPSHFTRFMKDGLRAIFMAGAKAQAKLDKEVKK